MPATSSCRCDARSYLHAHCYCSVYNCNGKAVSRSTYQHHRNAAKDSETFASEELQGTTDDISEGDPRVTDSNPDPGIYLTNLFVHDLAKGGPEATLPPPHPPYKTFTLVLGTQLPPFLDGL